MAVSATRSRSNQHPPAAVRTAPVPAPGLPTTPIPQHQVAERWPVLWWVGCHGGAGATTMARITGLGVDGGAGWPVPGAPNWPVVHVVLVCRASAAGTWAATGAVEQFKRRQMPPGTNLLGLVAVAASARRPPRIAAERLQLLGGWAPALWRVGWVEEYLAADNPLDVGVRPEVVTLRHALGQAAGLELGRHST